MNDAPGWRGGVGGAGTLGCVTLPSITTVAAVKTAEQGTRALHSDLVMVTRGENQQGSLLISWNSVLTPGGAHYYVRPRAAGGTELVVSCRPSAECSSKRTQEAEIYLFTEVLESPACHFGVAYMSVCLGHGRKSGGETYPSYCSSMHGSFDGIIISIAAIADQQLQHAYAGSASAAACSEITRIMPTCTCPRAATTERTWNASRARRTTDVADEFVYRISNIKSSIYSVRIKSSIQARSPSDCASHP